MKKTLYSLMLSDDVVREIDILAHRMGTNRSNLVNRILADHVSLRTPEEELNDIFRTLEEIISPSRDLVPFFEPNMQTMSLKSCLEYKYRPTVRYEVELYGSHRHGNIGVLSVILRTQSAALIGAMTEFFSLWKQIEDTYLPTRFAAREYSLYDGKFTRSIACKAEMGTKELAEGISNYVQLFDTLMKRYISGTFSAEDVIAEYINALKKGSVTV